MNSQPKSIRTDDRLDEALDEFERFWSSENQYLFDFVSKLDLIGDPKSIEEFVRADIDRRYAANLDVDLTGYLNTFSELRRDPKVLLEIAFEDFRSRRSRGLSLALSRWSWVPGIEKATWFAELKRSTPHPTNFRSSLLPSISSVDESNGLFEQTSVATDWSENREPRLGDRFGGFQLLAILGRGSFSTVFLATQLGLASRYVALKVVRRTLDEPAHLARLQHTGIVPLFSLHRIGPYSALCMPYFGSATLADWLGDSKLPSRNGQSLVGTVQSAQMRLTTIEANDTNESLCPSEIDKVRLWNAAGSQPLDKLRCLNARQSILWLAQRLAAALAHAHERGVLHGDLKPANILIRNDGEPALIDFNLSKNFERAADCWAGGTLPYMSPEQLQILLGQSPQIDARADIYALGIILFELVENRLPYPPPISQAESDVKVALDDRKQRATLCKSTATSGLKAIIGKCLSFAPGERYTSAVPLLEDIEREIANLPLLHARENFVAGRATKLFRRYPRLFSSGPIILVGLVAISLLASIAAMGWNRSHTLDARARLTYFRSESKAFLADLVEPTPSQWNPLLERLNRLTNDVLGLETATTSDKRKSLFENGLKSLSPEEREAAEQDIAQFCIAAIGLTCSSAKELTESQRESLLELLRLCSEYTQLPKESLVLDMLQELLRTDEPQLPLRYEASMRELETQLDSVQSPTMQYGLIELLQARSDAAQKQARNALERLRSIDVRDVPAHLYWMVSGDSQFQIEHPESALQAYSLAIASAPKSVTAYVERAKVLQALREYKLAELDFSKAISLASPTASLYMRRALVRQKLRNFDGAIQDMDAALELAPKSNRMLFVRAKLHQLAQNPEQHREDLKNGLASTPIEIDDWIARALAQLPRYPERAKSDLQAALRIDPMSSVALQNLAFVEAEHLHNTEASLSALDQILHLDPENESALAGRSVLLARLARVQDCLHDLETLSKREPRLLSSTLYQMGSAHALISNQNSSSSEQAVRFLARAILRGYGADVIASDPDLDPIRDEASFVAIINFTRLDQNK